MATRTFTATFKTNDVEAIQVVSCISARRRDAVGREESKFSKNAIESARVVGDAA